MPHIHLIFLDKLRFTTLFCPKMNNYILDPVENAATQQCEVLLQPCSSKPYSEAEAGAEGDWASHYPVITKSSAEPSRVECEYDVKPNISSDPKENTTSFFKNEETEGQDGFSETFNRCDTDESEDIELKNVLDLENVLKSMHGSNFVQGRMEGGHNSFPLDDELERVMKLESALRKVNGNLSEFKSIEEALRKIHDNIALSDDEKDVENLEHGVKTMTDVELALQNDPLILEEDFRQSFTSIEEWASSQLKQQDDASSSRPKDVFTIKGEGEVMKSAKILFAKKTKTLFRWLHPKDSKSDLRQRVDRAWDRLSRKETEFYYSQVLGPFNHRQVKPMINPRIFELLNIPESLRPTATTPCNDADDSQQKTSEECKPDKLEKPRKIPKSKPPSITRRKRGPYKKKTTQSLENSSGRLKRRKRSSSSSSSSDREYSPTAARKRTRETRKKPITTMGKLRLKFCKMKTTKMPVTSESEDDEDDEEECSDKSHPYKLRFGGMTRPPDPEISVELTQGLEECDKLLDSDNSM